MVIKQLQQKGETFAPQTVSEAVLVVHESLVKTLKTVLNLKIENIVSDDLTAVKNGLSVAIVHANTITPSEKKGLLLIKYDSHGHITESSSALVINFNVNGTTAKTYDGLLQVDVNLGDDFLNVNDTISIRWNDLNN